MKQYLRLFCIFGILFVLFISTAWAGSEWGTIYFNDDPWITYANDNGLSYFYVDIPDSISTLSSGSPLQTPYAGKNITFDADLTSQLVYDSHESMDLAMFDTDPETIVTMTFNGFQAIGWGLEIFPKTDGVYYFGISCEEGGVYTHFTNDSYPTFIGYKMTDPFTSLTVESVLKRLYDENGNLIGSDPGEPFYFGKLVFMKAEANPIPIPGSFILVASGLAGLVGFRRKFRER